MTRHVCGTVCAAALLCSAVTVSAQQVRFDDVIRNLRNPDPKVRLAAVQLLRESKYPEAIAPMAALVLSRRRCAIEEAGGIRRRSA
jgi:hypothetical protein